MSLAQLSRIAQVCTQEKLQPVLAPGRAIECADLSLYVALNRLGRRAEAEKLLIRYEEK